MLTYVYAHFPKLVITKAVIVMYMYMVAMLVLEVHLSSVGNPSKNQMVRTVRYGDDSPGLRLADVCPMPTLAQQSTPLSVSRTSHENVSRTCASFGANLDGTA